MLSSKGQLTFGEDSEEIHTLGGRVRHITLRVHWGSLRLIPTEKQMYTLHQFPIPVSGKAFFSLVSIPPTLTCTLSRERERESAFQLQHELQTCRWGEGGGRWYGVHVQGPDSAWCASMSIDDLPSLGQIPKVGVVWEGGWGPMSMMLSPPDLH